MIRTVRFHRPIVLTIAFAIAALVAGAKAVMAETCTGYTAQKPYGNFRSGAFVTGLNGLVTGLPTPNCTDNWWTATSDSPWMTLAGTTAGAGSHTFRIAFDPNDGPARTAHINFSWGQSMEITQEAAPPLPWCYMTLPATIEVSPEAGSAHIDTPPNCAEGWWAVSTGFITIAGAPLANWYPVGNWYQFGLAFTYPANPSTTSSRVATITFHGRFLNGNTVVVTQPPAAPEVMRRAASLGDFNGDGLADVSWRIDDRGANALWTMSGAAKSSGNYIDSADPGFIAAAIADFDGDHKADIFWRNLATGANFRWLMDGTNVRSILPEANAGVNWVVVGAGDFIGNGKAGVLWRDQSTGQNAIWLSTTADASWLSFRFYLPSAPTSWRVAGVADFDGDGNADILWHDETSGGSALWLMNCSGVLYVPPVVRMMSYLETTPVAWHIAGVGDFNHDGRADILLRDPVTGANSMWLMNGTTKLSGAMIESAPPQWSVAGIGDFNGDGKADIFWRDTAGNNSVWLMDGMTKTSGTYLENAPLPWDVVPHLR